MRVLLFLGGLLVALPIGAFVVWSVLADASMLVEAGGWWMLLLYLIVPVCVALYALFGDNPYRPDR
jgi:hypothetical protein